MASSYSIVVERIPTRVSYTEGICHDIFNNGILLMADNHKPIDLANSKKVNPSEGSASL